MRTVRRIAAFLIGFVFFIAGILKLMDPVGAGLVVESYYKFMKLLFMMPSAKYVAVALAFAETVTGAALMTGVWKRLVGIVSGAFLGFFTLISLVLFIANPDMDCGCFGEAIHLTHAQTFFKNLVLLALWALSFIPLSCQEPARRIKYVSFWTAAVSVVLFMLWSVLSIPMIDFTKYAPGQDLLSNIEEEKIQEIPTLSLFDANGEYRNELVVDGNVLAVSVYDVDALGPKAWARIEDIFSRSSALGFKTVLLAAATASQLEAASPSPMVMSNSFFGDRKEYMTLNRSNGGLTYIADGQIVEKWASASMPDDDHLRWLLATDSTEAMMRTSNASHLRMQGFLLYVFAVLLLL